MNPDRPDTVTRHRGTHPLDGDRNHRRFTIGLTLSLG